MATKLNPVEYDLYKRCQGIKNKAPNGIPLNKADRTTVLTALRRHPNAKEKFGNGIQAIVADRFIYGSRCFFIIRADGSAVDFSLHNCFYPKIQRSDAAIAAMSKWDYTPLLIKFRRFMAARHFRQSLLQPQERKSAVLSSS